MNSQMCTFADILCYLWHSTSADHNNEFMNYQLQKPEVEPHKDEVFGLSPIHISNPEQ